MPGVCTVQACLLRSGVQTKACDASAQENLVSNDSYPDRSEAIRKVEIAESIPRPVVPAIRWGAVLAGVAVGVSLQLALILLGLATGLSAAEVTDGEMVGMGPLIWAGVSMLISAFFGGYVAARMSGFKRRSDGVLHGAVSWAVTTILFAFLATSMGGSLVGGVFGNMNHFARGTSESSVAALMRAQGGRLEPDTLRRLQQYIQAGQRDEAVQLLITTMNMEQQRAEAIVDQALILSGLSRSASPQGRLAVENAMQSAGTAAWIVFLAVALALAIGISGGVLGAAGSRRISWGVSPPPSHP
jgi:hypothetical protein